MDPINISCWTITSSARERWSREQQPLIERAGLVEFADPEAVLRALDAAFHQQYEITNRNARKAAQ